MIRVCECSLMDRLWLDDMLLLSCFWDKTHGQEQLKDKVVQNCKTRAFKNTLNVLKVFVEIVGSMQKKTSNISKKN